MRKKKVLVYGTPDSLKSFLADSAAREFEIVAVFNKSKPLRALPTFLYNLIDGIIFTDMNKSFAESLLRQGLEPRKIILYDAAQGWKAFSKRDKEGVEVAFICGLEFHIRDDTDAEFFNQTVQRLQTQRQFQNLDPKFYPDALMQNFQRRTGKPLDLNNLKTFTEKLQWLKIFDATPLKSRLADKYLVRNWITEKIGQEYLIPLLGVWDDFDDINFDDLPDQFVLKCNHGSGMNIIVRDKNTFDKQRAREKINAWLAFDFSVQSLELHYTRINRKIIAEKFMTDGNAPDLTDYKFWYFKGKPVLVQCETDRTNDLRFDYFDMSFNHTNIERSDHKLSDHPEKIPKPKNFELMKKLAAKLAEDFAFVRVDFYEIEGRVYFGEMTFSPGAGDFYYKSEGTDEYLGSLLNLPPPILNYAKLKKIILCRIGGGFFIAKNVSLWQNLFTGGDAMISVKDVSYTYMTGTPFEKTALKNISFDVAEGEVLAIAGHTGSGKSTLIQIIAGLIKLQSGTVELDGLSVADKKIRRLVGIVFQYPEHQLFEETVESDIVFGPKNFGLSDAEISARVDEAMRQVGLDAELKKFSPFELSGGQRRRVAIAGILALKPKYLILDEPTAGLDPLAKENLLKEIFGAGKKSGVTIILVSHNMEDIAHFANRVVVLAQGEILFIGTPRELFARDEILSRAGLEPPPITQLLRTLNINEQALTVDEAEKIILRNWRNPKCPSSND